MMEEKKRRISAVLTDGRKKEPRRLWAITQEQNKAVFFLYDPTTRLREAYSHSTIVDFTSSFIEVENMLYISGGDYVAHRGSRLLHTFDLKADTAEAVVKRKADMLFSKFCHSTANLLNSWLYSIGGKVREGYLNCCEKYSIRDDRWERLPDLLVPRSTFGLMLQNLRFFYVVGGWTTQDKATAIERLDVLDESLGWIVMPILENSQFRSMAGAATFQNCESGILICGGNERGQDQSVYQYFPLDRTIILKHEDQLTPEGFFVMKSLIFDHCAYTIEYQGGNLLRYDLWRGRWTRIKCSSPLEPTFPQLRTK